MRPASERLRKFASTVTNKYSEGVHANWSNVSKENFTLSSREHQKKGKKGKKEIWIIQYKKVQEGCV